MSVYKTIPEKKDYDNVMESIPLIASGAIIKRYVKKLEQLVDMYHHSSTVYLAKALKAEAENNQLKWERQQKVENATYFSNVHMQVYRNKVDELMAIIKAIYNDTESWSDISSDIKEMIIQEITDIASVAVCDHCGKPGTDEDPLIETVNPYQHDMFDSDDIKLLHGDCYNDILGDI